jgi:hypothetical protein
MAEALVVGARGGDVGKEGRAAIRMGERGMKQDCETQDCETQDQKQD